jgi:hypothetical protein
VKQHCGIVLKKHFSKKRTISVLDNQVGRIDYVPNTEDICVGALLSYWVTQRKGVSFIHSIEKLNVPLGLGKNDILFLHHVLEICYYFVPVGDEAHHLYTLMEQLYMLEQYPMSKLYQKSFLVILFYRLGIYPRDKKFQQPRFYQMAAGSIDFIVQQGLDLTFEQELNDWLYDCLSHHPALAHFKTVHFLQESREHEEA